MNMAQWVVELNCYCPGCGDYVNLMDEPEFWVGRELDIAEHGTDRSNDMEVTCPECGHEFQACCEY
jgi:hypothetical protein